MGRERKAKQERKRKLEAIRKRPPHPEDVLRYLGKLPPPLVPRG